MRKDDKNKYRYKRIELYLKPEEQTLFAEKAKHYNSMGEMIRDAVKQFNDAGAKRKLVAMNELACFYTKFQDYLSWLGGNFNQAMKRANELAIAGELTPAYFQTTLYPALDKASALLAGIKREHKALAKRIIHL